MKLKPENWEALLCPFLLVGGLLFASELIFLALYVAASVIGVSFVVLLAHRIFVLRQVCDLSALSLL